MFNAVVGIYFDAACKQPYQRATATITGSATGLTVVETVAYTGLRGQALGTLSLHAEQTRPATGETALTGIGTFKPANAGFPSVSLGITYHLASTVAKCQSGVAQTFPALRLSLASLTPLTVTPKKLPTGGSSVTFTGAAAMLRTGPAGSLSIVQNLADRARHRRRRHCLRHHQHHRRCRLVWPVSPGTHQLEDHRYRAQSQLHPQRHRKQSRLYSR